MKLGRMGNNIASLLHSKIMGSTRSCSKISETRTRSSSPWALENHLFNGVTELRQQVTRCCHQSTSPTRERKRLDYHRPQVRHDIDWMVHQLHELTWPSYLLKKPHCQKASNRLRKESIVFIVSY